MRDALNHALEKSLLTGSGAEPFHMKVHLFESTNPPSPYQAEIEEYWVSPQQWRRTIDSPDFKQTLILNGQDISEVDVGEYYPLWLKTFITGIFDLVPNVDQWSKINANIRLITLPDGRRSSACARMTLRIGNESVKNDNFANVCFDSNGLLEFAGWPGYGMEFHDYQAFGKKIVARRYQHSPESGTDLVANVFLLEKLVSPDSNLFVITKPVAAEKRLQSIYVAQSVIEKAAEGSPAMTWPTVVDGKTAGLLSMYISIDRQGQVQEAYPLNSDNAQLNDAARDQLLKWKLKPIVSNGIPVQAESALTFQFETSLKAGAEETSRQAASETAPHKATSPIVISPGVSQGFLLKHPDPVYPEHAMERGVKGTVVLALTVDKTGTTKNIHVVSSPDEVLTEAAIDAVKKWKYRPYQVNGEVVEVNSTVSVTFQLNH